MISCDTTLSLQDPQSQCTKEPIPSLNVFILALYKLLLLATLLRIGPSKVNGVCFNTFNLNVNHFLSVSIFILIFCLSPSLSVLCVCLHLYLHLSVCFHLNPPFLSVSIKRWNLTENKYRDGDSKKMRIEMETSKK